MPLRVGASDRDASSNERLWCHSEREQYKPVWRRKWQTTLAWGSSVSRTLQKEKLGAMVVLRFFAERWVAKWTVAAARRCPARRVSRETERGSTMYRQTWRLPSRCCLPQHRRVASASERSRCHLDRRVRQCKWKMTGGGPWRATDKYTRLSADWPQSALLRSMPRQISSLEPRVSFSNSEGRYCTMVWQKIRSVSHFLQPPAIDKTSEVKRKKSMLIKWRVDWREIESTHYVTIISARNTGTSTVFRAPFSTTFRWRIFLKPTGID